MHPLGSTNYGMIKLEQEHRLARLEHRRHQLDDTALAPAGADGAGTSRVLSPSRRLVLAAATATGLLAVIGGAALAFTG